MGNKNIITEPIFYTAARLEAIADRFIFSPMKLSFASVKILRILERKGNLTSVKIAEILGGKKSNISQRLNYLESKGFIKKKYAAVPDDKRKVMIIITFKGTKQLALIDKRLEKAQLCLTEYFSKEEIENHLKFFEKINKKIDLEEKNLSKIFK